MCVYVVCVSVNCELCVCSGVYVCTLCVCVCCVFTCEGVSGRVKVCVCVKTVSCEVHCVCERIT